MDVDSTLVATEGIDLLAAIGGVGAQVAAITERAMRGELDFAASLRERVGLLAGLPASAIAEANAQVTPNPGAAALIAGLRARGWRVGLVSGGFTAMVGPLAERFGVDHYRANTLELADDRLTGRLLGPIVDRAGKAAALREWAAADGVALADCAAMGDGANDLDMMAAAGLSIAYRPKPAVAARADAVIVEEGLEAALTSPDTWVSDRDCWPRARRPGRPERGRSRSWAGQGESRTPRDAARRDRREWLDIAALGIAPLAEWLRFETLRGGQVLGWRAIEPVRMTATKSRSIGSKSRRYAASSGCSR
jgi:phosphoserine phosphatase